MTTVHHQPTEISSTEIAAQLPRVVRDAQLRASLFGTARDGDADLVDAEHFRGERIALTVELLRWFDALEALEGTEVRRNRHGEVIEGERQRRNWLGAALCSNDLATMRATLRVHAAYEARWAAVSAAEDAAMFSAVSLCAEV